MKFYPKNISEFLEYMPCLSRHEKTVMLQCKRETNQTLIATQVLQRAAFREDIESLGRLLAQLCRYNPSCNWFLPPTVYDACQRFLYGRQEHQHKRLV